jgi:NADPH-dependent 2,4-dienoyl-CoA reductase/sulfur reductase-like enzyme
MPEYKYLIVGGGMTADSAAKAIREIDSAGSIGIFSKEKHLPYNRPPLTKNLWKDLNYGKLWRSTEKLGADIHLNTNIVSLDVQKKSASDSGGKSYSYEKLLLATGGEPRKLPFSADGLIYYRSLADFESLKSLSEKKNKFLIIGGGFIGSEIAAALSMQGKDVTMVFPEELIGINVYPRDLAQFITNYYRQKGVRVAPGLQVTGIRKSGARYTVDAGQHGQIDADVVVAGIGIRPDVSLAEQAGIKTSNGIDVNEFLETSAKDVYSAGDAANFFNPHLGKRIRIEHADNANKMGRAAGLSMAGAGELYNYLPFFYSDMFELGYEAIGELNSSLQTVSDWKEKFKTGVIYYLDGGKVRGVLLWNVWGKVDAARNLIGSREEFKPEDLKNYI